MKAIRLYILSAGGLLLATALERFIIVFGDNPVLSLPDPLFGIPLIYTVLAAGILEMTAAWVCLFGRQDNIQIFFLAWLATNYAVCFVATLLPIHTHLQATAIGSITDPLHLVYGPARFFIPLIPFYLMLGSYAAAIGLWLEGKKVKTASFLKIPCPACGGRVKFSIQNLGWEIPCPHCQRNLTLREPENLKMSCFFCKERIEFPAHAVGKKMPCPHCNMDITLKEPA